MRTDGKTDMMKLIFAFRNFAKAFKKDLAVLHKIKKRRLDLI